LHRLVYLGYYLKELDYEKFKYFSQYVQSITDLGKPKLFTDILTSSLTYNISLLDYFYFRFYEEGSVDRAKWAGTGFMYEYQLKMNPKATRRLLEDKILFNQAYRDFIRRKVSSLSGIKGNDELIARFFENASGKFVLKGSTGQVGAEVKVIDTKNFDSERLLHYMEANDLDLIEEYVIQHRELRKLSNSGLNTIRVFSQLDGNGQVVWLGARLRITVNSVVDNMAAGNLAAPVDLETGMVSGPAVYSDITKEEAISHPVSKVSIVGFQVPYWQETLQMVKEAALLHPQNRSIGWDVAITDEGPELIEGNHNWCKLLWQLPVRKGLKAELEKFL